MVMAEHVCQAVPEEDFVASDQMGPGDSTASPQCPLSDYLGTQNYLPEAVPINGRVREGEDVGGPLLLAISPIKLGHFALGDNVHSNGPLGGILPGRL